MINYFELFSCIIIFVSIKHFIKKVLKNEKLANPSLSCNEITLDLIDVTPVGMIALKEIVSSTVSI